LNILSGNAGVQRKGYSPMSTMTVFQTMIRYEAPHSWLN